MSLGEKVIAANESPETDVAGATLQMLIDSKPKFAAPRDVISQATKY